MGSVNPPYVVHSVLNVPLEVHERATERLVWKASRTWIAYRCLEICCNHFYTIVFFVTLRKSDTKMINTRLKKEWNWNGSKAYRTLNSIYYYKLYINIYYICFILYQIAIHQPWPLTHCRMDDWTDGSMDKYKNPPKLSLTSIVLHFFFYLSGI